MCLMMEAVNSRSVLLVDTMYLEHMNPWLSPLTEKARQVECPEMLLQLVRGLFQTRTRTVHPQWLLGCLSQPVFLYIHRNGFKNGQSGMGWTA